MKLVISTVLTARSIPIEPVKPTIENAMRDTTTQQVTAVCDPEYFVWYFLFQTQLLGKPGGKVITVVREKIIAVSLVMK